MFKLNWFRKSVLVVLIVALITTLPLPLLDSLFSPYSIYAASDEQSTAYSHSSPLSEALETTNGLTDLLPPEMTNGLSGMGMFGANGEPEGVLMDVGAIEAALNSAPRKPDSLANPISISRAQSAYQPGAAIDNQLTITFTVTNNRPPAIVPQVPVSATITDSIAIMSEFDYANDPNTMRNVMVVDALTDQATYIASSPLPDQDGATNAWNLGDIAPLSSTSFTMTLQIPASVSDFTDLDTGATAWGTLGGRQVTAQSSPATLTPETINGEPIGDWLKWTVDADIYDEYMLQKAAEIGQAPETLFAYVRSLGYESYSGSLRGTRGTIWSEAGNSLDQASLLIAMLRTSGIPARYRHGTLETNRAQELILSMFPEPTRVIGHIPEGIEVADPANDPQLLAETEDHWWVEAYIPSQGGWTDLDPSFPNAAIGERFVTDSNIASDGSDQIAEVPDNVRHKVTVKLKVEEYHVLNIGGTNGLEYSYPLIHTFNTVELVGNPVTLGHIVNTTGAGGLVFSTTQHTYVPYFLVGDDLLEGNPYQDLLTNFPLGTQLHTAVWLIFETQDADGNVESYEREIVDRIGFEARQGGGNTPIELPEGNPPLLRESTMHQVMFAPSKVPASTLSALAKPLVDTNEALFAVLEQRDELDEDDEAEQALVARAAMNAYRLWGVEVLNAVNVSHYSKSDEITEELASGMLVKPYATAPRLIISSMDLDDEGIFEMTLDLLGDDITAYAYPSQNIYMVDTFQSNRGYMESYLEGLALESVTGRTARTTHNVFEAWRDLPDADIIAVTSDNLDELEQANISDEAKARIIAAVQAGKVVITPNQMVTIDGLETIGWWENDPQTGAIEGVMENGLHSSLISYGLLLQSNQGAFAVIGFLHGISSSGLNFVSEVLEQANCVASSKCATINFKEVFNTVMGKAINNAVALIASIQSRALKNEAQVIIEVLLEWYKDPTFLQNLSMLDVILWAFNQVISHIATTNKLTGQVDQFNAGNAIGQIAGLVYLQVRLNIDPPLPGSLVAISPQNLFQNQVSVPISSSSTYSNNTLSASLTTPSSAISSTVGSASFYAPALSGMGFGGDGAAYGAANYADSATFQAQGANLMVGAPAGGTLQVGSQSVSVPNGVAIAGYGADVSITEASATTDQVTLAESEADFFTLDLSEDTSTTNPVSAVNFQANISANFDETYTMTVEAPDGWHVEVDETGLVTATPPLGAVEADYTLLVVAQSGTYLDLFASALHTITVTSYEGMELSVNPDLLITIPWGPTDSNTLPSGLNNGQMQIPGAAFTVDITNTSNIAHEFTLDVSGLPEGWLVLSGEEGQTETTMTLPAGEIGQVGLYISPTLTTLPPVGTEYPFTVDAVATDNADLSASDDEIFIVPGIAFSQVEASPFELYSEPGSSTTFDLSVRNVGNITGSFPLSVTRPVSTTWTAQYNEPLSLAAGEANTQTVTLLTPDGQVGDDYVVSVLSPSGAYTQTTSVVLHLVGPYAKCAYDTAQQVVILDNVALTAVVEKLATKMSRLENELAGGDELEGRDEVVAATEEVIQQLGAYLTLPAIVELQEISQVMPTHTEAASLSNDLAALCDALSNLSLELQAVAQHGVSARFVPALNAALPNQTVPVTLTLTNQGTEQTDYTLSITSPLMAPINQTISLAPDEVANVPLEVTPTDLGFYNIEASIEAPIEPLIQAHANAGLNVVDAFVQILQVEANPAFVETGISSTTLSIDVANIANIYLPSTASMNILAPDGSEQWSDEMPLGVRTGDSRTYTLATVNTSGWESGTYTVTVDLLDDTNTLIPDGSGNTYLLVGQGLEAVVVAHPPLVAPGTVTVSTFITTTVHQDLLPAQVLAQAESNRVDVQASAPQITFARQESPASESEQSEETAHTPLNPLSRGEFSDLTPLLRGVGGVLPFDLRESINDGEPFTPPRMSGTTGIVRHEEDDAGITYSGNWSTRSESRASSGQVMRSSTAGDTASFTFTGTWVGVGFASDSSNGQVELFIDGASQGIIDTYSRYDDVASYYVDGLSAGSHTISLTVLGTSNPNASNSYVALDYIDVWDGTAMADGTFEHDSGRVSLSDDWFESTDDVASGGTYVFFGSNAWFPFTGDSVTFQAIAGTSGDEIEILIDGQKIERFDLYHSSTITRTFSFDGLGAGAHMLQISQYRGTATVDAFTTPGSAPFYELPPTPTGIIRYEEDDPALLYNGVPFEQTAQSWNIAAYDRASEGHAAWSQTLSDTVSLTFTGSWVGLGLMSSSSGGLAEVFIDGVSQGVVDTYSNSDDVLSLYYNGLTAGTHSILVTVLGAKSQYSSDEYVRVDYIDVWDGTAMADGSFEHDSGRVSLSDDWFENTNDVASGGTYVWFGSNAWFPFTGDSVTFEAIARTSGDEIEILIDGQKIERFDLYHSSTITRTFSFDGLGVGAHMLQINRYRGTATVDAFTTPGSAPFYELPPAPTGIIRYQEDDPALLYNGVPFEQTAQSWNIAAYDRASEGHAAWSQTLSDTVSLTFTGSWVGLGLLTRASGGLAEVFIDGVSQGVVDTYSTSDDVLSLYYDGLTSTTHTISVMVLASSNPNSSDEYVRVDYIDLWDGSDLPQGFFEEDDERVHRSPNWQETSSTRVNGGSYIQDGSNAWFFFTGDEVTYVGVTDRNATTSAEVFIDGVSQGVVDLNYDFSRSPVPFHYTNLGDGPHVMHINNLDRAGVDAFDTSETPFAGIPMVEWYDSEPLGGVINSPAAGDLDGDGTIEIAATSYEGHVYVYRGDGSDAGNGTPLIWSADVGGEADAPAMANLDGQPGAEIVFASPAGLYAYHHDGTQYWFTDTVRSTWRGVSIANMDDDPEPEIVATGEDCPCVVEHDGTLTWRHNLNYPLPPLLADLTGDGRLDILTASDNTLYLFDYALTPPAIVWERTFTNTLDGRGTPAIANVDGQLPGGDEGPEIAIVEDGFIHLVDADGSLIWSYATAPGAPGGVSIADTDGDGEVEIIASAQVDGGRLYVLNADGSLLWHAPAQDSTSANSGSVLDLDGDGIWEIIWNGFEQGLTIFRGSDGQIIFNEPFINSSTRMDYPIIADVDGDEVAEIVTGDDDGLYVVGYDSGWAPSRPLWNQYNYHITNIRNDLSVPEVEPDSWVTHNTYRTQTPIEDPFAGYQVDLTHTIAESGMEVLPDSFSAPPDTPAPSYHWSYEQLSPSYTTSFDAVLPDMQPGEVRQISESTVIAYQFASGSNLLTLPPLYVAAAHIIAIEPVSQTITTGSRAIYDVTLSNPSTTQATYSLAVSGLPDGWVNLPQTVNLSPESEMTLPMTITVPTGAELAQYDFSVRVDNGIGGHDQTGAILIVADLLDITVNPESDFVLAGEVVTYTVTITNAESVERSYALTHTGLEGNVVTLPDTVTIAANSAITTPLVIEAYANRDTYLFSVQATTIESQTSSQDHAVLELLNDWQVAAALNPQEASGGPGTTVPYTLTVTNSGSLSDTYDLAIDLPAGWTASFNANGTEVTHLSLTPYVFNSANFTLLVTPPTSAIPGSYDFTVTVQSRNNPESKASVEGTTIVTPYGVQVAISPANLTLAPTETGNWDVTVTNTGVEDDTYLLIPTGIVAGSAQLSQETVSVAAGQSETVQLSADILEFALERSYQFEVIARSTTHDVIQNQDSATLSFTGYEAVEVAWRPSSQIVTDSLSVAYMLVITNTGNLGTTYQLSATISPETNPSPELDQILYLPLIASFGGNNNRSSAPTSSASASLQLEVDEVYIPPHMTAGILVTVNTNSDGTYSLEATANSISSPASGSDNAELTIGNVPTLDYKIMLPIMLR